MQRTVNSTLAMAALALVMSGCGQPEIAADSTEESHSASELAQPRRFVTPRDAKPLSAADAQPNEIKSTSTFSAPAPLISSTSPESLPNPFVSQTDTVGNALRGIPESENNRQLRFAERHRGRSPQEIEPPEKTIEAQDEAIESIVPWERPVTRPGRVIAAVRQADARTRNGIALARRGARLSARTEFVQALRVLAEAMDEARGCTAHRDALARGITAVEESGDFLDNGARLEGNRSLAEIVAGHRTPILHGVDGVTAAVAYERYLEFAQEQLSAAVRNEPVGSMALYGLGRSTAADTKQGDVSGAAMACYSAALSVDRRNFLAANELGVLLARGGRYQAARGYLVASWNEGRNASTLKNLVAVHRKLGETRLAQQAERLLASMDSSHRTASVQRPAIRWTDAASFAATSQPAPPATRAATNRSPISTTGRR